ncbi:MAG: VCBS repeat-containing protein, partial [Planctomycetales bacterium]|nr:VCBS repeat-containing protein [Planctomycetales bacterium]
RASLEFLEARRVLAAIGFAVHDIGSAQAAAATSMIMADLNGDQRPDMLTENVWRANDGAGGLGQTRLLFTGQMVDELFAADLDGDGDLDLVVSGKEHEFGSSTVVAWYENLDGRGFLSAARPIDRLEGRQGSTVTGGDLDGDGDVDLVAAANGVLKIYENTDGRGTFVESYSSNAGYAFVTLYDVDADEDLDIVASGKAAGGMDLLENRGDQFVSHHLMDGYGVLVIEDVNRDGVLDFIVGGRDEVRLQVYWSEFHTTTVSLAKRQEISSIFIDRIWKLALGDVDGDGDLDLGSVFSRESGNSNYNVGYSELLETGYAPIERRAGEEGPSNSSGLALTDVDGNGTVDLIYSNAVEFSDSATGQLGVPQVFAPLSRQSDGLSILADIDSDGDDDVIASDHTDYCYGAYGYCTTRLSWYENVDGVGSFAFRRELWSERGDAYQGLKAVKSADLDGDGDLDIVLDNSYIGSDLVWLENLDGKGSFGPAQPYAKGPLVDIVDLDGDGRDDLLTSESGVLKVSFDLAAPNKVDVQLTGDADVWQLEPIVDWDGDGDLDIVLIADKVYYWFENLGNRTFAAAQPIITRDDTSSFQYQFVDVDGDGDRDAIWTTTAREVVWQANMGAGVWGLMQPFATQSRLLNSFDLDGDGDVDTIVVPVQSGPRAFLNDGTGHFADGSLGFPATITPVQMDLDGDGDLDLFDTRQRMWYEQRVIGDANGDGRFDSSDLVAVFQAGQYDDWITGNSIFQTGDFNGDGEFDSADLVNAFQAGAYVA